MLAAPPGGSQGRRVDRPQRRGQSRRRRRKGGERMTVGVAIVLVAHLALSSSVPAADPKALPGSDWPMYRHDPALTAASPLRGGFAKAPQVAWSVDLGGANIPSERIV